MTIWMPELQGTGPKYRQLGEAIRRAIDDGTLAVGDRLPPQRRLAWALGVTVGTVTRAYSEAERAGWVDARVGSGTYVAEPREQVFSHVRSDRHTDAALDLSLALPPAMTIRDESFRSALAAVQADPAELVQALDYQPEAGPAAHREVMAGWLADLGFDLDPDRLLINQGGMNGIFIALSTLLAPGERVAAERLTYPGLISVAAQLNLKTVALDQDVEGLCVSALAERYRAQPFKALYVMPDCQNPTTACLSEARRRALAAFAIAHDVWLIEDSVQHLPESARGTPLHVLAPEHTVFLFSISKILGGGLRSGVMAVPKRARERLAAGLRNICWMPPPLISSVVCRWIASGDADRVLAAQWQCLAKRAHRVAQALSGIDHALRPGGFYVWIRLPEARRASEVAARLAAAGLTVAVAEVFCLGSEPAPQAIRLCFSAAADDAALDRVLVLLRQVIDVPAAGAWQTI